eukprot:scaffold49382_cov28-Tisochrysis_lutea.AAC.4
MDRSLTTLTTDVSCYSCRRLETVIPKEGSRVLIVNGAYRGSMAQLVSINMDDFCVAVKISDGVHAGRTVERVEYEDVCKLDIH